MTEKQAENVTISNEVTTKKRRRRAKRVKTKTETVAIDAEKPDKKDKSHTLNIYLPHQLKAFYQEAIILISNNNQSAYIRNLLDKDMKKRGLLNKDLKPVASTLKELQKENKRAEEGRAEAKLEAEVAKKAAYEAQKAAAAAMKIAEEADKKLRSFEVIALPPKKRKRLKRKPRKKPVAEFVEVVEEAPIAVATPVEVPIAPVVAEAPKAPMVAEAPKAPMVAEAPIPKPLPKTVIRRQRKETNEKLRKESLKKVATKLKQKVLKKKGA